MDKFTELYNYLKEQGLTDLSAEEFKVEYASGTDKNSELYSYLKDESLTDLDSEEFNVEYFSDLVKKKDQSIVPSEEVVTELPTTQEVEVSTESDASFTEPQKIFNQYVDEIDADFTGQEEEFAVPEMKYKLGDYGFKFEETGMFGDKMKVTAPNGKKITIDLDETLEGGFFTKSDKETAETLKDFLKKNQDLEQQFNREEEDYIKEKARIKDEKDVEEGVAELNLRAEEYNDDVKTYVAKSAELKEMKEVYGNLTSEQMLGEYNEGYTKYLDLKENLEAEAKRLSRENDGLELQGMRLDRNVGKWSEMKREQGTWSGTFAKSFIQEGIGGILSSQRNLATNIKSYFISLGKERGMEGAYSNVFVNEAKKRGVEIPESLEINNEEQFSSFLETVDEDIVSSIDRKILDAIRKKELYGTVDFVATPEENEIEIVYKGLPEGAKFSGEVARLPLESGKLKATREGLSKMIGGELSSHQYDELAESEFWIGSLKGVTASLPALVGGKLNRVLNLTAQVTDHLYKEMANDPDFIEVPEWEKATVAIPIGIAVGALEDFGFRNVMKQKGVVAGILMKAMGKVPKGASVKTLTKVIREEVKSSGGRFALSAGIATAAEAETGLLQEITDIGGKALYNLAKEKDMFRTPDSVGEYVTQVLRAAAQEAVGGFVLGVPNSIATAYSKADFTQVSDLEFETFTQLTSDNKSYQEYKTALATKLKQQLNAKEITQQEADDTMDAFERVVGVQQGIPTDMSVENQKKALGLSLRLQELKSRAEGTNDAFNKNTNKEIAKIQEQIDNLVGAEVATQEELGIEEMVDETIAPEVTEESEVTEEVEAEATEEVTPELQTIEEQISEMDGTVEDNLNEVSSVKAETKEAIDGVKKKIADVRKDGSLSREEKSEAIEELKAEIQDLKDDASSQTETLKEERAEVKREQNKLKRKAKKLREAQPVVAEVTEEVSSKTQDEVTSEEKQDIDAFFGEDVAESTEQVTPKISINRKISDTEKSTKGFTRTQRVVINTAKSVAKAIARVLPETNIIIHETEQEYAKYANPNSRAEFNPSENTIHINLSKAKRTTAAHEAFHALLLNAVKNNDAAAKRLADKFMVAIRKVASGKLLAELDAHAAKYKDTSLQTEEQVAELIGILSANYGQMSKPSKNKVIAFLRALGKSLGIPRMEELTKSEEDVVDLLNTLSSRLAAGIELQAEDVSLLEELDNGTNPIGTPTEIVLPKTRESRLEFKDSYENSLVTPEKQFDITSLIKDIVAKKQKVWFWVADQLGINETIDGGPSFAHQVEGDIWASSVSTKTIEKNSKEADYLFIISGSPEVSKLFNKKVYDVMTSKLGDFNTFKKKALEAKPIKVIKDTLNEYNSWEELKDTTDRKPFLIALNKSKNTPNTAFTKFVNSIDGYTDIDALRDGFYRENDFKQNDIMLVLKPTGARQGSNHSTYNNTVEGEVIGVPDRKIDALQLMPKEMREKYEGKRAMASQAIAPYGSGKKVISPEAGAEFDKLTTEEKSKARQQLIGENALMQQGVRVNYTLAKEMTRQGKSPLVIKRATGWELGKDNMWKYETEDTKLVDSFWKKTPFTFDKTLDNAIKGASYSLKDIVKTDIVKQYPKIGEAKLYVTNTFKDGFNELMTKGSLGFYDAENNQIVINSDIFKGDKTKAIQKFESVLNHELQHAIQFIEGFTVGSNKDISMQQALNLIDALTIEYKQNGKEEIFNDISELRSLVKALEELDNGDTQAYLRIGGEVESRNVQKRMEMTDKQKRESLLESTEDVRPEDIIYVFDDYQRTRFTPKKAKTRQQLDTYPMETEGQWYGEGDFKARGGVLTMMSPQDFLSKAKNLEIDEETRENVDDLKKHIQDGKKLDPLTLYSLDATDVRNSDGRHRAIASQELGIQEVPVVDYTQVKTRNQLETVEYINEARDNNFTDAAIKDFLVRRKGMSATEVDELLAMKVDKLTTLPKSFGNVKGGAKVGLRLFERVKQFQKKETARNKKRKNPISQAQIMDKTIEFLEAQPEYKKEAEAYVEKGVTKYKKGLSVQQAKMQSELQKSTGQRPTQNMGQKLRAARLLVRQSLRAKKNLQALKRELRNFMRKALPKDLYTKSETMKLINKITIADENNIENLMDEIIEFAASKNVAALKNQINSFLKGKYTDLQGNRVKGYKIDVATKEAIDRIKKFILPETATSEEILSANEKLLTQYNKLDADPEQTSEIVEQMTELMIAMNINNSYLMEDTNIDKVAALDAVSQFISDLVTEGKTRLKAEMAAQSEEYKRQFAELYEDVTGDKVDLKDSSWIEKLKSKQRVRGLETKRNKVEGRLKNLQRKMANAITSNLINTAEALDGLMDMISKMPGEMFGGKSQELVTERIDASSRVFKARRMLIETMLRETMQKYYGKNWKKKSREFRKTKVTGIYINKNEVQEAQDEYNKNRTTENKQKLEKAIRENELILSQNQMYYYYNQYKDSANHPAFQNMYGVNYARVMEDMTNALEPEVKEFADWQVEVLFPALYNHYNATYRKIYRTNMPQHENYAGKIYREGVITEPMDLISGVGAPFNNTVGAASTKVREETNAKIAETDGSDALFTYLYDMEYFAAYAEAVRDINKLFTNEYIKKAIEDVHGKYTMSLITTAIQKLANKGTRTGLTAKWINGMNNVFITSRLGLNPVVMIKQLTSFVTYANDIGFANWAKYAFTNMSELKKLYKEVRDNSVYMQDRKFDGIMRAIESYADSTELKSFLPNETKDFMNNFLLFTTKFGDRAAIYLGGLPNYSYYKAEFKKKNPNATEQEAIDHAVIKFERDTKRTQQSGDLQDKDLFQTSDPISRALNMFLTTPKQYLRKEIQASRSLWRKLKAWDKSAGKGTVTQNIRTMFTYHIMMPVFFQWIAMGLPGALRDWRDDEEEDLLRAAIIGNLNAFFILGEMVNMAGDFFTAKPWAGGIKTAGILNQSRLITESAVRASKIKDPEKAAAAWRKFQLELVSMTGLPASNVNKMSGNIQKLVEGGLDPGEAILRILNFSEYQIKGMKKKKPSKKEMKLTKKEMKKYFPELYDEMEDLRDLEYEEEMKELKAQQREERERMLEEMYNDY